MLPILEPNAVGARDPVCGMTVNPDRAAGAFTYGGRVYHFCSKGCLAKFEADPERYLLPAARETPPVEAPAAAEYTCPMHPEVRQKGPGACPKCGMALEPVRLTDAAAEEVNPEYGDMRRRFWWSVPLTAALLALMYAGRGSHWIEAALATPVVVWAGWPLLERGWASVVHRSPNMFTLIAIGTGTAYVYSVIATLPCMRKPSGNTPGASVPSVLYA